MQTKASTTKEQQANQIHHHTH